MGRAPARHFGVYNSTHAPVALACHMTAPLLSRFLQVRGFKEGMVPLASLAARQLSSTK